MKHDLDYRSDFEKKVETVDRTFSLSWNNLEKERCSLILATLQLRNKLLKNAFQDIKEQKLASEILYNLLSSISETQKGDLQSNKKLMILEKVQSLLDFIKKESSNGLNEDQVCVLTYQFLKTGREEHLDDLIHAILEKYEDFYQQQTAEALACLETAASVPSETFYPEDTITPSVSLPVSQEIINFGLVEPQIRYTYASPYNALLKKDILSPEVQKTILCDTHLVSSLSQQIDKSDQSIHSMLDDLEKQNKTRSNLRFLLQKLPTLPEKVQFINAYPEVEKAIQNVSPKLSGYRFSWKTEEEKRNVINGVLHTLTEGSYETKLIYSKMSQEISRRSEFVKVFGHIINSLLDCETKFLKNMRW